MLRHVSILCALLLSGVSFSSAIAGEFEFSGYGGWQSAPHSDVTVSDGTDFRAGWEGKSFSSPAYWGVRGTYWFEEGQLNNLGISLDYTHDKVYADDQTLARSGWSHFEFTDGLNLLTLNALYRFPLETWRLTWARALASTCRMWRLPGLPAKPSNTSSVVQPCRRRPASATA
jgi:lipid A oxidase